MNITKMMVTMTMIMTRMMTAMVTMTTMVTINDEDHDHVGDEH